MCQVDMAWYNILVILPFVSISHSGYEHAVGGVEQAVGVHAIGYANA
jgi:hypothetical protein